MVFKYFTFGESENIESIKKQYWKLAQKWHPDFNAGKTNEQMKIINNEYKQALNNLGKIKNKNYRVDNDYIIIVDEVLRLNMQGVEIEICGWFVYLWGETKPYKEELKRLKFIWNPKRSCWYWKPAWYRGRNRRAWSMDRIRSTYGSEKVNQEEKEKKKKLVAV